MKKIILLGLMSILFVGITFAQTRIGITAGLNASNLNSSSDGYSESGDFKAGFQAGLVADFAITENFSVIPELLFSQRGAKAKDDSEGLMKGVSLTLNYLQLPVNVAYKFDAGMGSKVFIFAGPYLGYGLSTSAKVKTGGVSISTPDAIKFGSGENDLKALDYGVNAGIGYQYEKIFFKLQYNLGLANLSNDSDYKLKNVNVAVTAGYFFN